MGVFASGTAFLLHYPEESSTLHLCIAITDPYGDPPGVLIVPVNSHKGQRDDSCILNEGDHPFIRHKSVVTYALAKHIYVTDLERQESACSGMPAQDRWFIRQQPVSQDVMKRVINGALTSKAIPKRHKNTLLVLIGHIAADL